MPKAQTNEDLAAMDALAGATVADVRDGEIVMSNGAVIHIDLGSSLIVVQPAGGEPIELDWRE